MVSLLSLLVGIFYPEPTGRGFATPTTFVPVSPSLGIVIYPIAKDGNFSQRG